MELHSTTSLRRVRFLVHAASMTTQARRTSFARWDFMAPNIANGALAEQQEHIVKSVGPRGYAKSTEQVQPAEKQSCDRPKDEGIGLETIAERADIVEGGENERAEHRRGYAGDERAPAQQLLRTPRDQSDEDDAKQ